MITTSHPTEDPWELLRKARRANGLRTLLYLSVSTALILLNFSILHQRNSWYQKEREYAKQAETLKAENRRLREHCQQEESPNRLGALALR